MTDLAAAPASAALESLATHAWDAVLHADPIAASAIGDHRFGDRLPPNDPASLAAIRDGFADLARRVETIDAGGLSPAERVTRAALRDFLGYERDRAEAGDAVWAVDPLDGPQVRFLNIPVYQRLADPSDVDMTVARWRTMGPWVERHVANLRASAAGGRVAPLALVRRVVAELDDLLGRPDETWPLLDPTRVDRPEWPAAATAALADGLRRAVRDGLRPAFADYRSFLLDELGRLARPDDRAGLEHVPGGDEAYRRLVRAHTSLDLRPEEIHRIGLEETARIDAEFVELGASILGSHGLAATLTRLRTDPELHFGTSAEVLVTAEAALARANDAIAGWFGRLPRAACVVVEMAAHESKHSTIAYYLQPAADGRRPGRYYLNTTEPATRPRYEAETLAFHEAVPGHHLQLAIGQELDGLPAFRRFGGPTAFVEGWGLYSERLSEEMGLLSGPLDRFGILSFDAWRASRLVVDTGLHAMGWTRDAAIAFMTQHTALAENNIANVVDRYLAMPGQALAYKLGQLEFLRLRAEVETALGTAFDVRAFHDVVLGQGAVGLATLRTVVADWLATRAT